MKRIPLCAAVLLLFSLLACKNKPAASSDKRPASASDTLSEDRKSTRLNSSHIEESRMPSSA